ncbi:MAG: sugar ABC transporter permease [Ruminococcaceae bacterium]|nr:sugar ABC transporter permease [Oscillospiraceae bacterium]
MPKFLNQWQLYLFLAVPLAFILIFSYWPMLGIQLAFKRFDINLGMWESPWIGMDNFIRFFNSYQFKRVLVNTVFLSFYDLLTFPVPVIFALFLNCVRGNRFKKTVQTVTYIPHFISTVVMVGLLMQTFNPMVGVYGTIYKAIFGEVAPDMMANADAFPHMYVWSNVWQTVGWNSIVYIAALTGVDASLHEAAEIDGASRFKRMIHIDVPSILPTAVMLLIIRCGSIMNIGFEKTFLMQNDLNLRASEVISTYVYKVGLSSASGDFGRATAIGLFNSLINFLLIITVNAISKKVSEQSLW